MDLDPTPTDGTPPEARAVAEAEREEKARREREDRMHREVTLLFEHDPIGRLIAALLRHKVEDES